MLNGSIRPYKNSDLSDVTNLYLICFANHLHNPMMQKLRSGEFGILDWKYGFDRSSRFVYVHHGQIVGHVGGFFREMILNGKKVNTIELMHVIVHPDFRRRGIATELCVHLENISREAGIDLTYVLPNKLSERRLRARQPDYMKLADVPLMVKTDLSGRDHDLVEEVDRFGLEVDDLFERVRTNDGLVTIRNHEYLNRRSADNLECDHQLFVCSGTGNKSAIQGYVVLKSYFTGTETIGHILDMLAESEAIYEILTQFSENYFEGHGLPTVSCYCMPGVQVFGTLSRLGFKMRETGRSIFVKPLDEEFESPFRDGNVKFNISMLDHNIY